MRQASPQFIKPLRRTPNAFNGFIGSSDGAAVTALEQERKRLHAHPPFRLKPESVRQHRNAARRIGGELAQFAPRRGWAAIAFDAHDPACRLVVSEANPNEQKTTGQPMLGFACGSPPTCSQTITLLHVSK